MTTRRPAGGVRRRSRRLALKTWMASASDLSLSAARISVSIDGARSRSRPSTTVSRRSRAEALRGWRTNLKTSSRTAVVRGYSS